MTVFVLKHLSEITLKGTYYAFLSLQPINDVTKLDLQNNEVRVCSTNPPRLFVKALNALFSSVFLFFFNLRPLVSHSVLGFPIGSSGVCVFEHAQSEQSKPLEAGQELK